MAKTEPDGFGYWNVNVIRSGRYEITFRLGPTEQDWIPALKLGRAHLRLNSVMKIQQIQEGMKEIRFTVNLSAGAGQLEAYLTGQRKDGEKVSPFFVDVRFLD